MSRTKRKLARIDLSESDIPSSTQDVFRAVVDIARGGGGHSALLARARERIAAGARDGLNQVLKPPTTGKIRGARIGRRHDPTSALRAIRHNSRAIDALARSQEELARALLELQARGDFALLKGILQGLTQLEQRVQLAERASAVAASAVKAQRVIQGRAAQARVRAERRQVNIEKLTATTRSLQTAAFGTRGDLLAKENVLLAANQLFWSFGGDALRALKLIPPGATPVQWLAPLGSLVSSQALLASRVVDDSFLSGVTSHFGLFDDAREAGEFSQLGGSGLVFSRMIQDAKACVAAKIALKNLVKAELWPRVVQSHNLAVSTRLLSVTPASAQTDVTGVGAVVVEGNLYLAVLSNAPLAGASVAWVIDLRGLHG